jgi:predicted esterase
MALAADTRLGSYVILAPLGAGGMGEVYRARHVKLGREVAVKVLPAELASHSDRRQRFEREARAASSLNHPNIVTIYDIDEQDGVHYIAMELVGGHTLRSLLKEGAVPPGALLSLAVQIAQGLAKAHEAGIVHRDLKPDNVMVTADGLVKILDFGLAKLRQGTPSTDAVSDAVATETAATREGIVLGTLPYMSPEQVSGRPVDERTDQFSLGVLLYEMVCGQRPFRGDTAAALVSAILTTSPAAPRSLRREVPSDLDQVIRTCLQKDPVDRYASTADLARALVRCAERLRVGAAGRPLLRRPAVRAVLALGLIVAGVGAPLLMRESRRRWARFEALPRVSQLADAGDLYGAYRLAREAERHIPADPQLREVLNRVTIPISIVTEPAGAKVSYKRYSKPESEWAELGETPLQGVRVPYALMRWRIIRDGYETFEGAPFGVGPFTTFATGFALDRAGTRPAGMVRVPGGPLGAPDLPAAEVKPYWLDQYEVTNEDYRGFVEQGGYEQREHWAEPFLRDGREVPWPEAMAALRDATGRPGPARWELGAYPDGQGRLPVGGVSWYEAAAYCRSVGKGLPTVYHWYRAIGQDQLSDILTVSNFGGKGPAAVGSHQGLGAYGTYDMAGNVKEWCWNSTGDRRYILGGSWDEAGYMFRLRRDARSPWERLPTHGVRCARMDAPSAALLAPWDPNAPEVPRPVTDEVFAAYRRLFAYDPADLQAVVESTDDSTPQWRKETVSFRAAYGNERVTALLFLPRSARPPYQTVVWFPGDDAFFAPSSQTLASAFLFDFLPRSGRALVYPVYKGMYERRVPFTFAPQEWRDMMVAWSRDLGRTIDYLETRRDVDARKLAYYGFSSGAVYGPVLTTVDGRFAASVLLGGGLNLPGLPPEMANANFAPRCRVPTLMIAGRDDFLMPVESSNRVLFRLLATADADKRLAVLDGGHIPSDRREIIKEVLGWLDRYLGPVEAAR